MVIVTEETNLCRLWRQEEQAVLCLYSTPGEEGKEPGVVDQQRGKKAVRQLEGHAKAAEN